MMLFPASEVSLHWVILSASEASLHVVIFPASGWKHLKLLSREGAAASRRLELTVPVLLAFLGEGIHAASFWMYMGSRQLQEVRAP